MKKFLEKVLFFIIVIINLYPVLKYHYFPTLDGALHLYNGHLIKEMWLGNTFISSFFDFNSFPVPNWTGHFMLAFWQLFLPAYLAEKIFLITYLIGLPYAFRYLIKSFKTYNISIAYLIFPFSYSYMFYLGFYNFSISMVFFFFAIGFWIRHQEKMNWIKSVILFLLISITYFSHISVYLFLIAILFGIIVYYSFLQKILESKPWKNAFFSLAKKSLLLLTLSAFTLTLCILFFQNRPETISAQYLPKEKLFHYIQVIQPIVGFIEKPEIIWTEKIFYTVVILIGMVFIIRIIPFIRNRSLKALFTPGDFWLGLSFIFLIAYYRLPDSDGWAGYFSFRILLFFYFFIFVWIASHKIKYLFTIPLIVYVMFAHYQLQQSRDITTRFLTNIAVDCNEASATVAENSSLIFMERSTNWLLGHFDSYAGIEKSIVNLNNSEAFSGYFPLIWKEQSKQHLYFDEAGIADSCLGDSRLGKINGKKVDYLLLLGKFDTMQHCDNKIQNYLTSNGQLIYTKDLVTLYRNDKNHSVKK